uniref:Uncharacterized protein n=1 Tax=Rhizophora mucronata TaxID=61149 RepID=A0A2P2JU80_RHIMU
MNYISPVIPIVLELKCLNVPFPGLLPFRLIYM